MEKILDPDAAASEMSLLLLLAPLAPALIEMLILSEMGENRPCGCLAFH